MYLKHFGLAAPPFSIAPDPDFAYPSHAQRQTLAALLQAIDSGDDFVKVTGEVGTGKTLTCRRLLAELASRAQRGDGSSWQTLDTVFIPNPCLTPRTLLLAIAFALKLPLRANARQERVLALLDRALTQAQAAGRCIVVCLDEAQAMPPEALEVLRRLSGRESGTCGRLQVVLFGQPELDDKLARRDLRALASRISSQFRLGPLLANETGDYLAHRLRVAGRAAHAAPLFAPAVAGLVHRHARGIPRVVNIIAHKSLLLACRDGAPGVAAQHVRAAAAATPYARPATALSRLAAWWQQARMRQGTPA